MTATVRGKVAGIAFSSSGNETWWTLKIEGSIQEAGKGDVVNATTYVAWDSDKVAQRAADNPSSGERPRLGIGDEVTIKANTLNEPRYIGVEVYWAATEILVHRAEK